MYTKLKYCMYTYMYMYIIVSPDQSIIYHISIAGVFAVCSLSAETRLYVWEKRQHLLDVPRALPRVLQAVSSWSPRALPDIYNLIQSWSALPPTDALELLLPW